MITELIIFIVSALAGGAFSYFFLRANPEKKAVVDEFVNKQSGKNKE